MAARPRVLVVGGGFAGLESAFLIRMRLHDAVDLTLVSDRDTWVFRPNSIYIPFGAEPESLLVELRHPLAKRNISFFNAKVLEVLADERRVTFDDGTALPYDYLVLATGSGMRPRRSPGLPSMRNRSGRLTRCSAFEQRSSQFATRGDAAKTTPSSSSSHPITSAPARSTR